VFVLFNPHALLGRELCTTDLDVTLKPRRIVVKLKQPQNNSHLPFLVTLAAGELLKPMDCDASFWWIEDLDPDQWDEKFLPKDIALENTNHDNSGPGQVDHDGNDTNSNNHQIDEDGEVGSSGGGINTNKVTNQVRVESMQVVRIAIKKRPPTGIWSGVWKVEFNMSQEDEFKSPT
jgi:hypothetical protein